MGFKPSGDELAEAMARALAGQQNEELALVKAQLAVANDKNGQLERQIVRLKAELKNAEAATQFVKAFQTIVRPILPEPVLVPVMPVEEAEAARP